MLNVDATMILLLLALALAVSPGQAAAEEGPAAEKRQVSVMARDGQLPYEGKRYVGERMPDGSDRTAAANEPDAAAGGARREFSNGEPPSVYLLAKRYVGALARAGDLTRFKQADDKRDDSDAEADAEAAIEELLNAEELRKLRLEALREELERAQQEEKRSLSSLARNGDLSAGKRSISSIVRNGKRYLDEDWLDEEEKRNVASLARAYSLPGKRNIASFARNGWLRAAKRTVDWDDMDEDKRNLPSLLKSSPRFAGKRYLGAFVASNGPAYYNGREYDDKRNVGAARNFAYGYGKRYWDDEDEDYDEGLDEAKRHVGSVLAQKSFAMRRKKSIEPEDRFGESPTSAPAPAAPAPTADNNRMSNDVRQHGRMRRAAVAEQEYPAPAVQGVMSADAPDDAEGDARQKRYFAVRGGGKIPGGRLPHVGRSRSNNPNSGRRRH